MKIRFKDIQEKEGYIIPLSIIMYLNETYEDRDISQRILHYFLCYLNEEKNNDLLESYRNDINEIKISLNGLSNNDIEYNQKLNDYIVEQFCEFVKEKENNLGILVENIEDLPENIENLYTRDESNPIIQTVGAYRVLVTIRVSNLIDTVATGGSSLTASDVWAYAKALTVGKFLALK